MMPRERFFVGLDTTMPERQVGEAERAIRATIAAAPDLARRERLLRRAPVVGPGLAASLRGALPELGTLPSRRIAAPVGVAPFDRQPDPGRRPA